MELFHPDSLLSDEFYTKSSKEREIEPEKRLMLAILEDAVACFRKYILASDDNGQKIFYEAEEWILKGDNEWLFSFNNICETLRLNPLYVRQGLMRWKEKRLSAGRRKIA